MRTFHRKSAFRHFVIPAIRQFAILGFATWGLITFENPLIWIPLAVRPGLHHFQLHDPAARGPARQRVRAAPRPLATRAARPVVCDAPAGFLPVSSRGGTSIITRSWDPTRTIPNGIIFRRRSTSAGSKAVILHARALPDLLPGGAEERPRPNPDVCARRSAASARCRSRRICLAHRAAGVLLRVLRRAAHQHHPGVLHLSHCVHAEPAGPALRHRPRRPGAVGDADAAGTGSGISRS